MLAVLPFQSSPTRFVIPVYVMTRDLLTLYEPGQPAERRHAASTCRTRTSASSSATCRKATADPTVSAYDPLSNESTPARLLSREGNSAEFEIAATDYPRMLHGRIPGA